MAKHDFLSPPWVEAAQQIRDEHPGDGTPIQASVRMNLVVEEVPFGQGRLDAHLDTSTGTLEIGVGHLEEADVKVNLDYATAKAILVEGDTQAGMAAFMAGKVRIEGDMTKLLAFQSQEPTEGHLTVSAALRSITK